MSTTFDTPATIRVRSRGSGLIATVKKWWMSYFTRRIERAAIIQLHGISERELQDIGLTRSQIERAVRENVAAIGRAILSYRERAIIIQPMDSGLRGTTLRCVHEIRCEVEFFGEIPGMILPEEMLSVTEARRRLASPSILAFGDCCNECSRKAVQIRSASASAATAAIVMRALIALISSPAGDQGGWEAGARGL